MQLLAKNPDIRYQSAYGLKSDLMECQRRLLQTVSSGSDDNAELIPPFEIAREDRFMVIHALYYFMFISSFLRQEFTMPIALVCVHVTLQLKVHIRLVRS